MHGRTMSWGLAGLLMTGCGPSVDIDDGVLPPDTTDGTSALTMGVTTAPPSTTTTSTSTSTTTAPPVTTTPPDPDDGTSLDGVSFLEGGFDDGIVPAEECDLWQQDCPRDEKCMPWANDGTDMWNATTCRPVFPDPAAVGDACLVEGNPASGFDNCELGAMCWNVDADALAGVCVPLCGGSPAAPQCADPDTICAMANDGVINLCLPACDPLLQDCDEGQGCYPWASEYALACSATDPSAGPAGDPCSFADECEPGSLCTDGTLVPGCAAASCCTRWCDLREPVSPCLPGQECVPFFEEGAGFPPRAQLGVCASVP